MANRILLVNPAKRPGQRKKRRTAKQIAATKKLVALNKKRAKLAKRKTNPVKKRSKPMAARKRKTRRTAAQRAATKRLIAFNRGRKRKTNPIRKRRTSTKRRSVARRTSAAPVRRRRRNPIKRGIVKTTIMPAVTAATGALALDVAWAYLPIPVSVKTGPLKHVAKAAGAIGLSMLAGNVVKKSTADAMGLGALTVVMHNAAREYIAQLAPQIKMDGLGYYSPGLPTPGNGDMGLYVSDQRANPNMGLYVGEYDETGAYQG